MFNTGVDFSLRNNFTNSCSFAKVSVPVHNYNSLTKYSATLGVVKALKRVRNSLYLLYHLMSFNHHLSSAKTFSSSNRVEWVNPVEPAHHFSMTNHCKEYNIPGCSTHLSVNYEARITKCCTHHWRTVYIYFKVTKLCNIFTGVKFLSF